MNQTYRKENQKFLPVLPLKNLVALPKSIIPVVVGRKISIKALEFAIKHDKEIFVTAQKAIDIEVPKGDDLFHYGTRAVVLQMARMPNGAYKILVEGISRAHIENIEEHDGFLAGVSQDLQAFPLEENSENKAIWRNLFELFKEYVSLNEKVSADVLGMFRGLQDLDHLTDTIAVQIPLDFGQRQSLLELVDLKQRALKLSVLLKKEIEVLNAEKNSRKRDQRQIETDIVRFEYAGHLAYRHVPFSAFREFSAFKC